MKDFVIVVQGGSIHVEEIRKALKGFNVIFSTWEGNESKYLDSDIVVYNKIPTYTGPANLNLQKITTMSGLTKAKELGYKRALKLRSDLVPTNSNDFIKLLDNDYLNFLCWHSHEVYPDCPGYLVDYLMSGKIDDLLVLWDIKDMSWCNVPEIHITQQYINELMDKVDVEYFLQELNEKNDLFWIKRGINLRTYQANKTYNKFGKFNFELNKEHLVSNYTKFLKKNN